MGQIWNQTQTRAAALRIFRIVSQGTWSRTQSGGWGAVNTAWT
jgi:hypothetical protein